MVFQISTANLINLIVISAGIGVCGLCFLHITTSVDLQKAFRRYFGIIFILLPIYMATYLARRIMEGIPGSGVRTALYILPFVEIFCAGVMTYTISLLFLTYTKSGKYNKLLRIVMHVLLAANTALLVYGTLTGEYYYFDESNFYHRGAGYLVADIVPFIMLLIDIGLLIRHGKKIGRRVKLAFWIYMIAPIFAMLVQSISYGIQYIMIATTAGSVFMYFALSREQAEQYERQTRSIAKLQNGLILVMADLVESRDKCTGDHIRRTAEYTRIIMEQMIKDGSYTDQLTDEFIEDVVRSAPLHDIGKIQVSDVILNKPGKLTPEEFDTIKIHVTAGRDIISSAIDMVSEEDSGYLNEARNLAYCHHEKWNGTGYPQSLSGEDIPLSARIMAVAGVFDALVSKRSYKDEFPFDTAMDIIREGVGTHFDPKVAEAFIRAEDRVREVTYPDGTQQ
ncbi:MAG: HD domain-containing protein [Clostridia bacterium]|nr:HD domain-containing protein [Clostridia bacterium]